MDPGTSVERKQGYESSWTEERRPTSEGMGMLTFRLTLLFLNFECYIKYPINGGTGINMAYIYCGPHQY